MLESLLSNDLLSSLIAFGLVLIPAVIIHELGHFLAAKSVGITILEFGIGYPPRLFKLFQWGETEFTFNLIPLGGFVRPFGEDMIRPLTEEELRNQREQMEKSPMQDDFTPSNERELLLTRGISAPKTVNDIKPGGRILFLAAGAIANVLFAYLIFVVIGLIGVEQPIGGRVFLTDIPETSALTEAGLQDGDYIERINGELFETPDDFFQVVSRYADESVELSVLRLEPRESFEVTVTLSSEEIALINAKSARLLVSSIQQGSPADVAGIIPGDYIVGLAGVSLADSENPFDVLRATNTTNEGKVITIDIIRNGEPLQLEITPRINPAPGTGHLGASVATEFVAGGLVYGAGGQQFEYVPLSIGESLGYGVNQIGEILRMIAELPVRLISGQAQPEEGRVISIVGITQLGGEFLQQSIQEDQPIVILRFIALVSIALGITNLLPLPPLDGGRILFVIIEMIRGKPLPARREEMLLMIGVVFLLSVGVIAIIYDILNPITDILVP